MTPSEFEDKVEARLCKLLRREQIKDRGGDRPMDAAYAKQLAAQMAHSTYRNAVHRFAREGYDADGAARQLIYYRNSGRLD